MSDGTIISDEIIMPDEIIVEKIKKTVDLICQLYSYDIITDAILFGSVARGAARRESDIDIYLINPSFEPYANIHPDILPENNQFPTEDQRYNYNLIMKSNFRFVRILQSIGVKFRYSLRKDKKSYYQLYNGELFHMLLRDDTVDINPRIMEESIEITRDMWCD
jgi:hypothetical protein